MVYKETSADMVLMSSGNSVEFEIKEIQDWIAAHGGGAADFQLVTRRTLEEIKEEFPIGNSFTLYKTTGKGEEAIWNWDNETRDYELLVSNVFNVSAIDGGGADDPDEINKGEEE
jgi:hypothetical protein